MFFGLERRMDKQEVKHPDSGIKVEIDAIARVRS